MANVNATDAANSDSVKSEDNSRRNVWDLGFLRITTPQSIKPILIPIPAFKPVTVNRPSDHMNFQHPLFLSILRSYKIQIDPIDKHTLIYQGVNGTEFDLLDQSGFYCALGDWASRPFPATGLSPLDATLSALSKRQPVETVYQITYLADTALSPQRESRVQFKLSKAHNGK